MRRPPGAIQPRRALVTTTPPRYPTIAPMIRPPTRSTSAAMPGDDAVSSMTPSPITVAAAAMSAVTTGVAMPSLRPLSTFKRAPDRLRQGLVAHDAGAQGRVGGGQHGAQQRGELPRQVGEQRGGEPDADGEGERQPDGEQAGREAGAVAEVPRVDPGGVGEQEQREGDLGQPVHGVRLDRDVDDGPRSVAQQESRGDEHDRSGHVEPLEPTRDHRPGEQEDDERDQGTGGHAAPP